MLYTIKSNELTVSIDSYGAELKSVKNQNGTEFIWQSNEIWSGSAPILFPICGGIIDDEFTYEGKTYHLPKHGFGRKSEFTVETQTENSITFLLCSNEETLKVYPFDFELRINFITADNKLNVTYNVKNLTDGKMYFSIGAHEGYATPEGIEEYDVIFNENETLDAVALNGNYLTAEKTRIITDSKVLSLKHDYFKIDALVFEKFNSQYCTLAHRGGTRKIKVEFEDFNHLLLWHKPMANYMCVEPWNGLQSYEWSEKDITKKPGIIELEKSKEYCVNHKITFEI